MKERKSVRVQFPVGGVPFADGAAAIVVGAAGDLPYARDVDLAGGVAVSGEHRDRRCRGVASGGRNVGRAEAAEDADVPAPLEDYFRGFTGGGIATPGMLAER